MAWPAAVAAQEQNYEDRLLAWALAEHRLELEPSPEGKRIEAVRIASEDIVAHTDPYPRLLNALHVKTRPGVIRRELTFAPGDPFTAEAAAESERNLRRLFVLAVSRVVAVRGGTPDTVVVLIVTKDLWSIRTNSEFNLAEGTLLQYLRIRPTEQNFLGLNHQLSADFELKLDTWAVGQIFTMRRAFGSRWTLSEQARLFFNRRTHALEGSAGGVLVQQPLTNLRDTEGFHARAFWDVRPRRVFRGREIWQLPYPDAQAPQGAVPFVYDARELSADVSYTRSYGTAYKLDLTGAATGYSRRYEAPASSGLDEAQRAWFRCNGLPRSEDAIFLAASARVFQPRYVVLRNIDALGLSEDFQLGPSAVAALRWSDPVFLSPMRYAEGGLALKYRLYAGDDLLTVSVAGSTRLMQGDPGCGVQGPWVNRRLGAEVSNVSPRVGPGRFVARAMLDMRFSELSRRPLALGGGNGLRGADAEQYAGQHVVLVNLEYRTLPVELWTLHAGLVLFADGGAAFPESPWIHSVGVGLRLLFPQFDRETFRIDFGWVLNEPGPSRPWPRYLSASFGQATDYRPSYLDSPMN